ncbi:putative von Willebrand factor type A domain protein [Pseudomonas phage psageK4]|uniref:von Willebrand factor type A domain protein n=1 Tax=Pseudomonas phage psageK4 TaxID=2859563 RepID=A0ABX8SMF2_9CAUD|nr:putative von Willebrand factor type A domain protein [Pseudomonas phage psageK4]QXV71777.1 putative von Willebrand factor type A domain protein [Pseudomonas phage psageK4]
MIVKEEQAVKIVFVLDESGSMSHLRQDVIGGFNTTIADQKSLPGKADVTLITFASTVRTRFESVNLQTVEDLTNESYQPSGGTAMNDAIGIALARVLADAPEKAIINIFTDGYENASREYTPAQVKELVKQAEAKGYQVVFLAANIDEQVVGASFGLHASATRGFVADAKGMETAYLQASASVTNYRSEVIQ